MQNEICTTAIKATIENTSTLLALVALGTLNASILILNTWLTRRIEKQRQSRDSK